MPCLLDLHLLGSPKIEVDGAPLVADRRKGVALLSYLAMEAQRHSRDALATLFWPEYDQVYARGNLRRLLSNLNKVLHGEWLEIDRESVALRQAEGLWVDVAEFQRRLGERRGHGHDPDDICLRCLQPLTMAVELYRDDFLTGFTLVDAPEFDQWQMFQTESLRRELSGALDQLVNCYAAQGELDAAITHARRRVALDPLDESAQRQLMQVYAWAGERTAALRQYQILAELLWRELDTEPAAETVELFQQINANRLDLPPPVIKEQPAVRSEPLPAAPVEGEMRVVTVLCAGLNRVQQDLVDADVWTVGVERLLTEMEKMLAPYDARVDRLLGDSVIAVFGATHVHEDDPERALRVALELRTAAQQQGYPLNLGVATGEVYIGPVGAGERVVVSAMGPVVNVAARLQAHVASGQILADKSTFRRTRQAFHYMPDTVEMSGPSGELTGYVLERARFRATKTRGIEGLRAELVGREEELAKLQAALQAAVQGRGQMVSIIGEAGVGKSRLVAELRSQSLLSNLQSLLWLEGRCLEMASATPYGPFIDLMRGYFAGLHDNTAAAIRTTLQELASAGLLTAEQVEEIGPLAGNLLSVRFGDEWDELLRHADPQQIRDRTLTALRMLVAAAARRRPLVLVLEDLHWADALSMDLIGQLMDLLADHALLLLCVYRPGREYPSTRLEAMALRRCPERYAELRLQTLTPEQSREMVESLLAIENLSPAAKELILQKAQGNPFFIEEIVRSLIDAGIVYREGERRRAREGIEAFKIPEGVQSVILDRLDGLERDEKRLLQTASVMGRLFRQRVLAELAPPTLDVEDALAELEERDFIYLERSMPEAEYSFKHVLTQEAVYSTLPRAQRTQWHRRVAEAVERLYVELTQADGEYYEELAYHYDLSDAGDKAAEYLIKAGEKARRLFLNDKATRYFLRALARIDQWTVAEQSLAPDPTQVAMISRWRLEALTGLGRTCLAVGDVAEAADYLRQVISLGKATALSPPQLARLHFWLGEALWWLGRYEEQVFTGEEGLALLPAGSESMEAALMSQQIAGGYELLGNVQQFRRFTARMAQFLDNLAYAEELRPAYHRVVNFYAFYERNVDEALRWATLLEQRARQHHDVRAEAGPYALRGSILSNMGHHREALAELQQSLQASAKTGDPYNVLFCRLHLLSACFALGDLVQAEKHLHSWPEIPPFAGYKTAMSSVYQFEGMLHLCRGELDQAMEAMAKAVQFYPDLPTMFRLPTTVWLGRSALVLGQRSQAVRYFQEALEHSRADHFVHLSWHMHRTWLLAAAVSALEESYPDVEAFRSLYARYRTERSAAPDWPLVQWYLEPGQPDLRFSIFDFGLTQDEFQNPCLRRGFLSACLPAWRRDRPTRQAGVSQAGGRQVKSKIRNGEWLWVDPLGGCSHIVEKGLELYVPNGRDLWYLNHTAPRLVRPITGDFAVETACASVTAEKPALGGVLLWKDRDNYLRLDRGTLGRHEVAFSGCVANQDVVIGRGRLSFDAAQDDKAERIHLRLERVGTRVNALCSADGEEWFTVGHVDFPVDAPVQVGVHAIGMIDRVVYPGAYPEGAAIRYESFRLWRR